MSMYTPMYITIERATYIHSCIYIPFDVFIHARIHTHIYIYIYSYIHTYIYSYTCIYTYIYS